MARQVALLGLACVLCILGVGCGVTRSSGSSSGSSTTTSGGAARSAALRLEDRVVGYSLLYPSGWKIKKRVMATEFAAGARCMSVEVIDSEPPAESGGAASILHSFVQVCAKRVAASSTLDEFMRQTYGASYTDAFASKDFGGVSAYWTRKRDSNLIFLQTRAYRIQVATAVVADVEKRPRRLTQVQQILNSFAV
jgi:hypothetical protein